MVSRLVNIFEKRMSVWEALQGEKRKLVYVEDITIKIDLIHPPIEETALWSLLGDFVERMVLMI